jgi:hypothetical protein
MKKLSSRLSIIAALVASQALAIESSQVTLPLDKYLELIKKPEDPSQTMIYSAQLSGDYKKSLNLKISGAAMGKRVVSDGFLAIDQRYALEDCKGTALLQVKDGQIALFPKADRFDVECRVRVEKWDDLQITFSNVLSVSASVKGVNSRTVALGSLQTRISFEPPLSEIQPVIGDISVVARYRITVLPEAQRFQYHLDLTNPNRATKAFEFALVNGESIIQETWCRKVRYFHLELEAPGLLLSEGTWSESYLDDGNRHAFNNAAMTGLFLDFEAGRSKGQYDHQACLPVLRQGLKLDEIHGRIALRAEELARGTKGRRQG